MATRSEKRIKTKIVPVRASPEEKADLEARAAEFGVSVAELCRRAIFSSVPRSRTDQRAISELAAMRADLGRLGGLLKGWMSGSFPQQPPDIKTRDDVVRLLRQIEVAKEDVIEAIKKIGRPK